MMIDLMDRASLVDHHFVNPVPSASVISTHVSPNLAVFAMFCFLIYRLATINSLMWTRIPTIAAFADITIALLLELYLAFGGISDATPMMSSINHLRLAILPCKLMSTLFITICLTFPKKKIPICAVLVGTFTLVPIFYFNVDLSIPMIVIAIQLAQITISLHKILEYEHPMAKCSLAATGVFHLVCLYHGADSPRANVCYHFFDLLAMLALNYAIETMGDINRINAFYTFRSWKAVICRFTVTSILGLVIALCLSDPTFQAFRSMMSQVVWSPFYFAIMAKPILVANPPVLSEVYKGPPRKLALRPFFQQHPQLQSTHLAALSIAGQHLPEAIESNDRLVYTVRKGFDLMLWMDRNFPQSDINTPLHKKIRMDPSDDGSKYYPTSLFRMSSMFPKKGLKVLPTPSPMLEAFRDGQILAYLCQFGIGNAFMQGAVQMDMFPYFRLNSSKGSHPRKGLVLDLRVLEKYETKLDYERYGGVAFFTIKVNHSGSNHLHLEWIVLPATYERILANKECPTFRRGEKMIMASLYFAAVAGKHLADIHQSYNLVAVARHNAFDYAMNQHFSRQPHNARPFNAHPLSVTLYLHLYSHSLAAELTVPHLVVKGGVFNQIFALTPSGLSHFLNTFQVFNYASDEDFEYRETIMKPLMGQAHRFPSFTCSLEWELAYRDIFVKYANSMVDAMYKDDAEVQRDMALRGFYDVLNTLAKLPPRHGKLQTKAQVSRFLSDTIFHLTVRHQVYGTIGVTGALDPRVTGTQVPKDGGPPGVDEWRALAYVSLATAHVHFATLLQDSDNDFSGRQTRLDAVFQDATPLYGRNKARLVKLMKEAFYQLQHDLRTLERSWKSQWHYEGDQNVDYMRATPDEIHLVAGY